MGDESTRRDRQREERLHAPLAKDQRRAFARDRDRLLYANAFRRLAGVTQVVGAVEGHVFHNRLTHTIKVAQVARRLAEFLASSEAAEATELDPDVVECAALAHDLGHPPFGHVAEERLNVLVRRAGDKEGFEGNAQSFRIASRLEIHRPEYPGLDLTRANLNAILKHPRHRVELEGDETLHEKFGSYRDDSEAFQFARHEAPEGLLSLEAEVMDVADSIAYSVHDLDDFHRAGLIPITELAHDDFAFRQFMEGWKKARKPAPPDIDQHLGQLRRLLSMYAPTDAEKRYNDPWDQFGNMQYVSSFLIARFLTAYKLSGRQSNGRCLTIAPGHQLELRFLQRLVWHYVIENPRLATQQRGHQHIIDTLFEVFLTAVADANTRMIPPVMHREVRRLHDARSEDPHLTAARVAADIICTLTDSQAALLHRRLTGISAGSIGDIAVV